VGDQLETTFGFIRSFMALPLLLKDRIIGVLTMSYPEPGYFTAHHAELAGAIAQQAAIAIENARLYARAQDVATLEERARLARELHDSVTQALFSMTLHARSVQMQLERAGMAEEAHLRTGVQQLVDLAQGALAEMRALIFELRPGALQEEGLVAALRKHAAALSAREEVAIEVRTSADRIALAAAVEEQLYRLAQEALNNAVKHARARDITVCLDPTNDGGLGLQVCDDGIGFDPKVIPPGHLGLTTMADRARLLGGTLEITSAPGQGTEVRVMIPGALAPSE
jgi:signal transduction histidine kinase